MIGAEAASSMQRMMLKSTGRKRRVIGVVVERTIWTRRLIGAGVACILAIVFVLGGPVAAQMPREPLQIRIDSIDHPHWIHERQPPGSRRGENEGSAEPFQS